MDQHDKRLATIRALLAKAEATQFPAEAEAFTAKASHLMAELSIEEAEVWASDPASRHTSKPSVSKLHIIRPYATQKAVLIHQVGAIFGCKTIRDAAPLPDGSITVWIVGFPAELELVETLVTSLMLQLTSAMLAIPHINSTAAQVAAWRRSFIMGFTEAVCERLRHDRQKEVDQRAGAPQTATTPMALVLAERDDLINQEFRSAFPHVRTSRVSSGTSATGRTAGAQAGQRADTGNRRVGQQRSLSR